jgi:hypothetical protein
MTSATDLGWVTKRAETRGRLLNENEAAGLLGLSVKTLRRWRWARKGLRWTKIGAAVRYRDPKTSNNSSPQGFMKSGVRNDGKCNREPHGSDYRLRPNRARC